MTTPYVWVWIPEAAASATVGGTTGRATCCSGSRPAHRSRWALRSSHQGPRFGDASARRVRSGRQT
jgi:hypothetical protein